MIRFIKVVNAIDKITDCVPIVSTVKNVGILLYQLAHKVNKVAPVKTSWSDDIKIHALSKDALMASIAMLPILGNLTCLLSYVLEKRVLMGSLGYLGEAAIQHNWGLKKHSYEVVSLHLARNPKIEKKLTNALEKAARNGNQEIFKLILDSRNDWSSKSIENALTYTTTLSNKQAWSVLRLYDNFLSNDTNSLPPSTPSQITDIIDVGS